VACRYRAEIWRLFAATQVVFDEFLPQPVQCVIISAAQVGDEFQLVICLLVAEIWSHYATQCLTMFPPAPPSYDWCWDSMIDMRRGPASVRGSSALPALNWQEIWMKWGKLHMWVVLLPYLLNRPRIYDYITKLSRQQAEVI
jgi:hypothetical protein